MKAFYLLLLSVLLTVNSYAQWSIGGHYSTFNIPLDEFKTKGFGFDIEHGSNKQSIFLTVNFGSKTGPTDSTSTIDDLGNFTYTKYNYAYNILQIAFGGKAYLIGDNTPDSKFGLFVGGGAGYARAITTVHYDRASGSADDEENIGSFIFDFCAGASYKISSHKRELCKFFLQGRADLPLRSLLSGSSDSGIPLISNTQLGVLIPFTKYKKEADEYY